ncbi:type 2 isopentenyl-diphosphate Delta-isomerase [Aurantimonas sp. MSK8Z-1]|uniref:type 2 isopentenyl-diphosphate Delta-isomerase n=1 Tax=Mangrovibrevibacter kandeliae TaxID=2968473 RepID=UPI00211944FB|nr:type 2 isopentenyl-diphosphate Delta-isomerase [Aurantimonas sp. MSK8Z-1]MCW4115510.1 type 2 isopentenyl-diphosphate Delta-isomerase [Aurantimonas sp. MSK8Z-1]
MPQEVDDTIAGRKGEHLDIVQRPKLDHARAATGFDRIRFRHCALPELDLDAIDLSTSLFGRPLRLPFLISSMTGGPERSARINIRLAEAAQERGVALAVGSQRVALEGRGTGGLDRDLRRRAPDVPILGNVGAAQLAAGWGVDEARRAVEMIDADALILHLNPLQEAVQRCGDRDWRGVLAGIERLARDLGRPVVVKEVGAGISAAVARRLVEAGVAAIDVAGAGGTSWAAVEAERARDAAGRAIALTFSDWGIPTASAIGEVRAACPDILLIGSGGIRNGVDAAKAIRLGADLVGQAAGLLQAAEASTQAVLAELAVFAEELRIACFCTGSKDLAALRQAPLLDEV